MKNFDLQVSKIVGGSNNLFWSQTHVFLPGNEVKKKEFGCLLASFCLKAKNKEEINIIAFGKEVLLRFQELYYANFNDNGLERLNKSLQSLNKEFKASVEIEIAAAVVFPDGLTYFISQAGGEVFIFRKKHLVKILSGQEKISSSGFLEENDFVVLGSKQFFELVNLENLKKALQMKTVETAAEFLAPFARGKQENSQTTAVIFKPVIVKSNVKKSLSKFFLKAFLVNAKDKIKILTEKSIDFWKKETTQIKIKPENKRNKAKKTTLTVAFILIFLLITSVILGNKKRFSSYETKTVKDLVINTEELYNQAISLQAINPLKAKALLKKAKENIEEKIKNIKNEKEKNKIKDWQNKIKQEWEKISKEYKLKEGEIFLDLNLIKSGFQGENWAIEENNIYILDKEKGTVLKIKLTNKSSEIAAGGKEMVKGELIGATENRIFVINDNRIIVFDLKKEKIIDKKELGEKSKIVDLVGFSQNAYSLDSQANQIWKYRGVESGLLKKIPYLKTKGFDFSKVISLAIDGNIWLLDQQGNIQKFVRGRKDFFSLNGLDKPFDQPIKLYTSKDIANLYVLDRKNTRIVVINKQTGEYQSQYFWPGIAGVSDLAAFEKEKKILLLSADKIYQIEIKD